MSKIAEVGDVVCCHGRYEIETILSQFYHNFIVTIHLLNMGSFWNLLILMEIITIGNNIVMVGI